MFQKIKIKINPEILLFNPFMHILCMNTTLLRVNKELIIRSNSSAVDIKTEESKEVNKEVDNKEISISEDQFSYVENQSEDSTLRL